MTQHHYTFTAIITSGRPALCNVTFTLSGISGYSSTITIGTATVNSECITGYVFAHNADVAKERAISELKKLYPVEKGYTNHDNIMLQLANT